MEQSSMPLKIILGVLALAVAGFLGFLVLQAAKPTIKNPQPLNGTTTPKGEVAVGADVVGEADLKEVRLRVDGKPVQIMTDAHSQRHWTVTYKAVLARGQHEAELIAVDQRGREQPYRWRFTATGPGSPPKFANPLPRQGARLAPEEALISLAASLDDDRIKTLALKLNGKSLISVPGSPTAGERTVVAQRTPLTPGNYTARAELTDRAGDVSTYEWKFSVIEPGKGEPDARFFPQTGQYVFAPFLDYWTKNGGLAVFGLPLTPDFEQQALTMQWFERARFERHPELPSDRQVQLGRLGSELRQPDPRLPITPPSDIRFFPETGHGLSGRFRDYWERNGGLAVFGLPLTEEITEGGQIVQWFERARFEYHAENAGTPAEVQLTQLGRTLWLRSTQR